MKLSWPQFVAAGIGLALLLAAAPRSRAQDPNCCPPPSSPAVVPSITIPVCFDQEIETKKMTLNRAQRITATVLENQRDPRGRLILARGDYFVGQVTLVAHAELGRKPAMLEVFFDQVVMGAGPSQRVMLLPSRALPVAGSKGSERWLPKSPSVRERGNLLADRRSNTARSTVLIVGGTGLGGATGGVLAGTLLGAGVGAGIGAGAGLVVALLAKGRDSVVPANQVFNLRVPASFRGASLPPPRPPRPFGGQPTYYNRPAQNTGTGASFARAVRVLSMSAPQVQSGDIQIYATAEAPNGTWDVFIESQGVQNGILYLRVLGYPTQSWTANTRAPQRKDTHFSWSDPYHRVKRVIIRGAQNSSAQAYIHPLGSGAGPFDTSGTQGGGGTPTGGAGSPTGGAGGVDQAGQRIAQRTSELAQSYERDLGARTSGASDSAADRALARLRGASTSQIVLRDALNRAAEAAAPLRQPMNQETRRTTVSRLLNRADAVERAISNVPTFPQGYRQSWAEIQRDLEYLADTTPGVIRP